MILRHYLSVLSLHRYCLTHRFLPALVHHVYMVVCTLMCIFVCSCLFVQIDDICAYWQCAHFHMHLCVSGQMYACAWMCAGAGMIALIGLVYANMSCLTYVSAYTCVYTPRRCACVCISAYVNINTCTSQCACCAYEYVQVNLQEHA